MEYIIHALSTNIYIERRAPAKKIAEGGRDHSSQALACLEYALNVNIYIIYLFSYAYVYIYISGYMEFIAAPSPLRRRRHISKGMESGPGRAGPVGRRMG